MLEGDGAGRSCSCSRAARPSATAPFELAETPASCSAAAGTGCSTSGDRRVFCEVYGPPPRLLVYGAVDTAESLCRAAKLLGWTTIVADARGKFATAERIPSADELIVAWPEEAFAQVEPDHATAVVVLTHDDKFDVPALKAALETEAFYIGALGSRRNQERRRERLLEAGSAEDDIDADLRAVRARHRRRLERGDRGLDPRARRSPSAPGGGRPAARVASQRIHVEVE